MIRWPHLRCHHNIDIFARITAGGGVLCDDDRSRLRRAARAWPSEALVKPWLCSTVQVNILIRVYTLSRSYYRTKPILAVYRLILQTQERLPSWFRAVITSGRARIASRMTSVKVHVRWKQSRSVSAARPDRTHEDLNGRTMCYVRGLRPPESIYEITPGGHGASAHENVLNRSITFRAYSRFGFGY